MFDEENSDDEDQDAEGDEDEDGPFSDSESFVRPPSPDRPRGWFAWLRGKVARNGGGEEGYKAVDQPN